ncbi:MAG: hypothetical protein NZ701_02505 [Roseiflexus sp.]|nr:hypothetical protein [Roseiflexus sp.]
MIRSIRLPSVRSLSAAQRRAVAEAALALACYLALALLVTWPLAAHWNAAVVECRSCGRERRFCLSRL